ncbi:hypothetical protein HK101_011589 [Irineochytrium annulatum]|nr:hypothetical protein HK101_011589 [Irineochytrium annulatum]
MDGTASEDGPLTVLGAGRGRYGAGGAVPTALPIAPKSAASPPNPTFFFAPSRRRPSASSLNLSGNADGDDVLLSPSVSPSTASSSNTSLESLARRDREAESDDMVLTAGGMASILVPSRTTSSNSTNSISSAASASVGSLSRLDRLAATPEDPAVPRSILRARSFSQPDVFHNKLTPPPRHCNPALSASLTSSEFPVRAPSSSSRPRPTYEGLLANPSTRQGVMDKLSAASRKYSTPLSPNAVVPPNATQITWRRRLVVFASSGIHVFPAPSSTTSNPSHAPRGAPMPTDRPLQSLVLGSGASVRLGPEEGMMMVNVAQTGDEWVLRCPGGRADAERWAQVVRGFIIENKSAHAREVIKRVNAASSALSTTSPPMPTAPVRVTRSPSQDPRWDSDGNASSPSPDADPSTTPRLRRSRSRSDLSRSPAPLPPTPQQDLSSPTLGSNPRPRGNLLGRSLRLLLRSKSTEAIDVDAGVFRSPRSPTPVDSYGRPLSPTSSSSAAAATTAATPVGSPTTGALRRSRSTDGLASPPMSPRGTTLLGADGTALEAIGVGAGLRVGNIARKRSKDEDLAVAVGGMQGERALTTKKSRDGEGGGLKGMLQYFKS